MPPAVGMAIAGIAAGLGTIHGANKQSTANRRAQDIQRTADTQAMLFAKEQEATRRREYEQDRADALAQWNALEARKQPYRDISQQAVMRLAALSGMPAQQASSGPRPMPEGFGTSPTTGPTTTNQPTNRLPLTQLVRPSRTRRMVETGAY